MNYDSATSSYPSAFVASGTSALFSRDVHTALEDECMRQSKVTEGKLVERLKTELKGLEGCMSGIFQPSRVNATPSSRGRGTPASGTSEAGVGPIGGIKILSMAALSKVMRDVKLRFLNIINILKEVLNGGEHPNSFPSTLLNINSRDADANIKDCSSNSAAFHRRLAQLLLREEGSTSIAAVTLPFTLGGPHVAPKLIMYLLEHILTPLLQSFSTSLEDWSRGNHSSTSGASYSSRFEHKTSGELRAEVIAPFCEILELLHCYLPLESRHLATFSSTEASAAQASLSTMTTGASSSIFTGDTGSGGSGVLSPTCLSLLLPLPINRRNAHNGGGAGDLLRRTLMEDSTRFTANNGDRDSVDDVLKGTQAAAMTHLTSSNSASNNNTSRNYSYTSGSGGGVNTGSYYGSLIAAAVEGSAGSLFFSTYASLSILPPSSVAERKFPFYGSDGDNGGVISHATSSAPLLWKEGTSLFFLLQHIQHVLESEVLLPVLGTSYIQMLMWLLRFESYARCVHGKLWIQPLVYRIIMVLERVTFSSSSSSSSETNSSGSPFNKAPRESATTAYHAVDGSSENRAIHLHTPTEEEGVVYTHLLDVLIGLPQFMFAFCSNNSSSSYRTTTEGNGEDSIVSHQERLLHRFVTFVLQRHQHKLTHNAHNLRFEAACLRSLRRLTLHLHAISSSVGGTNVPSHLFQNGVLSSALDQLTSCLCNAADHPMTERAEAWRQEVCGWWSLYVSLRLSKSFSQLLPVDMMQSGLNNMMSAEPIPASTSNKHVGFPPSTSSVDRGENEKCGSGSSVYFSTCSPKFLVSLFESIWPMLCRLFFLPVVTSTTVQRRVHYSFVSYLELFRFPCPASLQLLMDAGGIVWYSCTASFDFYLELIVSEWSRVSESVNTERRQHDDEGNGVLPHSVTANGGNAPSKSSDVGEEGVDNPLERRLVSFQLPLDTESFPLPQHRLSSGFEKGVNVNRTKKVWVASPVSHLLFFLYKELYGEAFIRVLPSKRSDVIAPMRYTQHSSSASPEKGSNVPLMLDSLVVCVEEVHGVVAHAVPSPIQHWGMSAGQSRMAGRRDSNAPGASTTLTIATVAPVLYWLHLLAQPCTLLHTSVEECDGLVRALFPLWLREMKDVPSLNIHAMVVSALKTTLMESVSAFKSSSSPSSPPPQGVGIPASDAGLSEGNRGVYNLTGTQHNAALVRIMPLLWAVWTNAVRRCSADTRSLLIRTCMTLLFPSQTVDRGLPRGTTIDTTSFANPLPAFLLSRAALHLPVLLKDLAHHLGSPDFVHTSDRRERKSGKKVNPNDSFLDSFLDSNPMLSCPSSVSLYFSLLHTLAAQQLAFSSSHVGEDRPPYGARKEECGKRNRITPAVRANTCFFSSQITWMQGHMMKKEGSRDGAARVNQDWLVPYHAVEGGGVYLVFLGQLLTYLRCRKMYHSSCVKMDSRGDEEKPIIGRATTELESEENATCVSRHQHHNECHDDGFISRASQRVASTHFVSSPANSVERSSLSLKRNEVTSKMDRGRVALIHDEYGSHEYSAEAPMTQPAMRVSPILSKRTRIERERDRQDLTEDVEDEDQTEGVKILSPPLMATKTSLAERIEELLSKSQLAASGLSRLTVPLLVSMMEWLYRSTLLFCLPKVSSSVHRGSGTNTPRRFNGESVAMEEGREEIRDSAVSDTTFCATVAPAIGILFCSTFLSNGPHVFSVSDDCDRFLDYHTAFSYNEDESVKKQRGPARDENRIMQNTVEAVFASHTSHRGFMGASNDDGTAAYGGPPLHPDSEEVKREMSRGVREEEREEVMDYESMCFMQMLRSAESYVLAVAALHLLASPEDAATEETPIPPQKYGACHATEGRNTSNVHIRDPSTAGNKCGEKRTCHLDRVKAAQHTAAHTIIRHLSKEGEADARRLLTTLSPQNDVGDGKASSRHSPGSLHAPVEPARPFFLLPSVLICSVLPHWTLFSSPCGIIGSETHQAQTPHKRSLLSIHVGEEGRRDYEIRQLLSVSALEDTPPFTVGSHDNGTNRRCPSDLPLFPDTVQQWVTQSIATSFASLLLRCHSGMGPLKTMTGEKKDISEPEEAMGSNEAIMIEWTTSAICLLHWMLRLHRVGAWRRLPFTRREEEKEKDHERSAAYFFHHFLHESRIDDAYSVESELNMPHPQNIFSKSNTFSSLFHRHAWMQRISQCILNSTNGAESLGAYGLFNRTSVVMTIVFNCLVLLIRENISNIFCWTRFAQDNKSDFDSVSHERGNRLNNNALASNSFSSSTPSTKSRIPFDQHESVACSLRLTQLLCLNRPLIRAVQRLFEDVGDVLSGPLFVDRGTPRKDLCTSLVSDPQDTTLPYKRMADQMYIHLVESASNMRQLVSHLMRVLIYSSLSAWGSVSQRKRSYMSLQRSTCSGEVHTSSNGPLFVPSSPHQFLTRLRTSVCTSVLMALRSCWSCLATLLLYYFPESSAQENDAGKDVKQQEAEDGEEESIRVWLEEAVDDFLCYHRFIERIEERHLSSDPGLSTDQNGGPTSSSNHRYMPFLGRELTVKIKTFLEKFTVSASPLQAPTGGASGQKVEVPPYSLLSPVIMDLFPLLNALQWMERRLPTLVRERHRTDHSTESTNIVAEVIHPHRREENEENDEDGWRASGVGRVKGNTRTEGGGGNIMIEAREGVRPVERLTNRSSVILSRKYFASSPLHPRWLWLRLYLSLTLRYGGKQHLPGAISGDSRDRAHLPSSFFFYSSMGFDGLLSALHQSFFIRAKTSTIKKEMRFLDESGDGVVLGNQCGVPNPSTIPYEALLLLEELGATFFPQESVRWDSDAVYDSISLGTPSKRLRYLLPCTHMGLLGVVAWACPWKQREHSLVTHSSEGPHSLCVAGDGEDSMIWPRCFGISLLPSIPLSVRVIAGRRFAGIIHVFMQTALHARKRQGSGTRRNKFTSEIPPNEVPSALQILLEGAKEGLLPSQGNTTSLEQVASTSLLSLAETVAAVGQVEDSILYTVLECWSSKTFVAHESILQWLSLLAHREANSRLLSPTYTISFASPPLHRDLGRQEGRYGMIMGRRTPTPLTPVLLSRTPLRTFLFHWLWASGHRIEAFPFALFGYPTLDHLILDGQISFLMMMGLLLGAKASCTRHQIDPGAEGLDLYLTTKSSGTVMSYRPSSLYDRVAKLYYSSFDGCRAAVLDDDSVTTRSGMTASDYLSTGFPASAETTKKHERKWVWSGVTDLTPVVDQLPQITALLLVLLEADGGLPLRATESVSATQQRMVAEHSAFLCGVRYTVEQQQQWKSQAILVLQWLDYAIRQIGEKGEMERLGAPSTLHGQPALQRRAMTPTTRNACLSGLLYDNLGELLIQIINVCSPSRSEYLSCANSSYTCNPELSLLTPRKSNQTYRSLLVRTLCLACSTLLPYLDWRQQCYTLEHEFKQNNLENESKRRKTESDRLAMSSTVNNTKKKGNIEAHTIAVADDNEEEDNQDTQEEENELLFSPLLCIPPPPGLKIPVISSSDEVYVTEFSSNSLETSPLQDDPRIIQLLMFERDVFGGSDIAKNSKGTDDETEVSSEYPSCAFGSMLLRPYAILTHIWRTMSIHQSSCAHFFFSDLCTDALESIRARNEKQLWMNSSSTSSDSPPLTSTQDDDGDGKEKEVWSPLLLDAVRWYTVCTELYAPECLEKSITVKPSPQNNVQGIMQGRRRSCIVICRFIIHRTLELLSFWLKCASDNPLRTISKFREATLTCDQAYIGNAEETTGGSNIPIDTHVSTQGVAYLCRLLLLFTPYLIRAECLDDLTRLNYPLSQKSDEEGNLNLYALVERNRILSTISKETLNVLYSMSHVLCPSSRSCILKDLRWSETGSSSSIKCEGNREIKEQIPRTFSGSNLYHSHLPLSFQILLNKTWDILCDGDERIDSLPVPLYRLHPSRIILQLDVAMNAVSYDRERRTVEGDRQDPHHSPGANQPLSADKDETLLRDPIRDEEEGETRGVERAGGSPPDAQNRGTRAPQVADENEEDGISNFLPFSTTVYLSSEDWSCLPADLRILQNLELAVGALQLSIAASPSVKKEATGEELEGQTERNGMGLGIADRNDDYFRAEAEVLERAAHHISCVRGRLINAIRLAIACSALGSDICAGIQQKGLHAWAVEYASEYEKQQRNDVEDNRFTKTGQYFDPLLVELAMSMRTAHGGLSNRPIVDEPKQKETQRILNTLFRLSLSYDALEACRSALTSIFQLCEALCERHLNVNCIDYSNGNTRQSLLSPCGIFWKDEKNITHYYRSDPFQWAERGNVCSERVSTALRGSRLLRFNSAALNMLRCVSFVFIDLGLEKEATRWLSQYEQCKLPFSLRATKNTAKSGEEEEEKMRRVYLSGDGSQSTMNLLSVPNSWSWVIPDLHVTSGKVDAFSSMMTYWPFHTSLMRSRSVFLRREDYIVSSVADPHGGEGELGVVHGHGLNEADMWEEDDDESEGGEEENPFLSFYPEEEPLPFYQILRNRPWYCASLLNVALPKGILAGTFVKRKQKPRKPNAEEEISILSKLKSRLKHRESYGKSLSHHHKPSILTLDTSSVLKSNALFFFSSFLAAYTIRAPYHLMIDVAVSAGFPSKKSTSNGSVDINTLDKLSQHGLKFKCREVSYSLLPSALFTLEKSEQKSPSLQSLSPGGLEVKQQKSYYKKFISSLHHPHKLYADVDQDCLMEQTLLSGYNTLLHYWASLAFPSSLSTTTSHLSFPFDITCSSCLTFSQKCQRRALLATHAMSMCGKFLASERISIPSPVWSEDEGRKVEDGMELPSICGTARPHRSALKGFAYSEGLCRISERVILLLSSLDFAKAHSLDEEQTTSDYTKRRAFFLPSAFPLLPNFCLRYTESLRGENDIEGQEDLERGGNSEASTATATRKRPRRRSQNPPSGRNTKEKELTLTPCDEIGENEIPLKSSSLKRNGMPSSVSCLWTEDMQVSAAMSLPAELCAAGQYLGMHGCVTATAEVVGGGTLSTPAPRSTPAKSDVDLHRAHLLQKMALFLHSDRLRLESDTHENSSLWALLQRQTVISPIAGDQSASAVEMVFLPLFLLAAIHTYGLEKRFTLIQAAMPLLRMEAMDRFMRVVVSMETKADEDDVETQRRLDTVRAEKVKTNEQVSGGIKMEQLLSLMSPEVPCYLIYLFASADARDFPSPSGDDDLVEISEKGTAASARALWRDVQQRCQRALHSPTGAPTQEKVESSSTTSLLFPVVWSLMMLRREAPEGEGQGRTGGVVGMSDETQPLERGIRQSWSHALSTHVFNVMGGRTQAEEDAANSAQSFFSTSSEEEAETAASARVRTQDTEGRRIMYFPNLMHHFLHYLWWSYRCRIEVTKRRGVLLLSSPASNGNTSSLLPLSFRGTIGANAVYTVPVKGTGQGGGGRVTLPIAIKGFLQHERHQFDDSSMFLPIAFAALPLLNDTTELYWLSDISAHRLARSALLLASHFSSSTTSSLSSMAAMWMELSAESFCGTHSGLPTRPLLSVSDIGEEPTASALRGTYVLFPQQNKAGSDASKASHRRTQTHDHNYIASSRNRQIRIQSFHLRTTAFSTLLSCLLPDDHCGLLIPYSSSRLQRRALNRLVACDALQEMCANDVGSYFSCELPSHSLSGAPVGLEGGRSFSARALISRLTGDVPGANQYASFSISSNDGGDDKESKAREEWFQGRVVIGVGLEEELNGHDMAELLAASSSVALGWGETTSIPGRGVSSLVSGSTHSNGGSYSSVPSHLLAILNRGEEDGNIEGLYSIADGNSRGHSGRGGSQKRIRSSEHQPSGPRSTSWLSHHLISLRAKVLINEGLISEAVDMLLEALSNTDFAQCPERVGGLSALPQSASSRMRSLLAEAACKCAMWTTPTPSLFGDGKREPLNPEEYALEADHEHTRMANSSSAPLSSTLERAHRVLKENSEDMLRAEKVSSERITAHHTSPPELVFASLCTIRKIVENGNQFSSSPRELMIHQHEAQRVLQGHIHRLHEHVLVQLHGPSGTRGTFFSGAENWLSSMVLLQIASDLQSSGTFCAAYATNKSLSTFQSGSVYAGPAGIAPQWMEELGGYLPDDRRFSSPDELACPPCASFSSPPPHHRALMVSNVSVELLAEVRQSLFGLLTDAASMRAAHSHNLWLSTNTQEGNSNKVIEVNNRSPTADCHARRKGEEFESRSVFLKHGVVAGLWSMWAAAVQRYGCSALSFGLPFHAHRWIAQFLLRTSSLSVSIRDNCMLEMNAGPTKSMCFYLSDALRTSLTLLQARSLYALGWGKEAIHTLQSAPYQPSTSACSASSAAALLWNQGDKGNTYSFVARKYIVSLPRPPSESPRIVHQLMQWELSRGRIPLYQLVRDKNFSKSASGEAAVSLQLAQLCHRLTKSITSRLHSPGFQRLVDGLAQSRKTKEHLIQKFQGLQREMSAVEAHERSGADGSEDIASKKKALQEKIRPVQHRLRALEADIVREETILMTEIQNYELYKRSAINSYFRYLSVGCSAAGVPRGVRTSCSACLAAQKSSTEGERENDGSRVSAALHNVPPDCAAHRWTMHNEARCQCDGEGGFRISSEGEVIAIYALVELWLGAEDEKVVELNAEFPIWQSSRRTTSRGNASSSTFSSSSANLAFISSRLPKIPTYCFLRVYPLMASQLGTNSGDRVHSMGRDESSTDSSVKRPTLQSMLEQVLERVAKAHPHECIWVLLALAHGDRFTMQDANAGNGRSPLLTLCKPENGEGSRFNGVVDELFGEGQNSETPYGKTSEGSHKKNVLQGHDGIHAVDMEKVRAARRILLRLASSKHSNSSSRGSTLSGEGSTSTLRNSNSHASLVLKQQVNEMAYLSMSYIELSFYQNYKTAESRNIPIPSVAMFTNLTNVAGRGLRMTIAPPTHTFSPSDAPVVQLGEASRRGCAGSATSFARQQLIIDELQKSSCLPYLAHYDPFFTTPGGITRPKVLRCWLSNGQRAKQLLKSNDDLRQDATLQRFFELTNMLFARATSSSAALSLRTYHVVPLAPTVGMIEWVEQTMPLGEYVAGADGQSGAHQRYFPEEMTSRECRQKMQEAGNKVQVLRYLYNEYTPALHYFFYENFSSTWEAWLSHQQRYGRSVATSSMVGYIVGLGDRHGSNLLLHQNTGEVVHIDLGYAFDQSKLLPIPERVPFRLTRNIVDGLGIRGLRGDFAATCATALTLLRAARPLLLLVMESILHDPLARWSVSAKTDETASSSAHHTTEHGPSAKDAPVNALPSTSHHFAPLGQPHNREVISSSDAQRALSRVADKLSGYDDNASMGGSVGGGEYLPPMAHVHKLIEEAQQIDQLALMYPGWSPWL